MKLSVIIPHYPVNQDIKELLKKSLKSLKGYDELILVVTNGIGFSKAVNMGLRAATGDYLMVVGDDTEVLEGNIRDLCLKDFVTSPIVNGMSEGFWGCFFCLPRWVLEKVGEFDEEYEIGYYEDDDYIMRLRQANIPMKSIGVKVKHLGGQTMKNFDTSEIAQRNKERFMKKWGVENSWIKK